MSYIYLMAGRWHFSTPGLTKVSNFHANCQVVASAAAVLLLFQARLVDTIGLCYPIDSTVGNIDLYR